jgi:hypothetical protein
MPQARAMDVEKKGNLVANEHPTLIDSLPVSEEYWNQLSVERKMVLLLPNEATIWGNLVAEFPSDWEKRAEEAVYRTLEKTKKEWDESKITNSEEIYEEWDEGYEPDPQPNMSGPPCTELPEWCVTFIEKLPQCTAMHFGFHVSVPNERMCYCPCSKKMETWRRQFGLEDIPQCNAKKRFFVSGLGQHLNTPHRVEGMDLHKIAYNYLVIVYGVDRLRQR